MADVKLSAIADGSAVAGATDKCIAVRSGTTDVQVTPVALDTAQTWTASQTLANSVNIVLSTGAGTKIGTGVTQKLGFWNVAPVAQPVLATGAAHTADDIITFLQLIGLCKQA